MDVLSAVMSLMRINGSALAEMRCGGDWGVDMGTGAGMLFHHVIEGRCWLLGESGPIQLSPGDLVVALHWPRHALASSPDGPLETAEEVVAANGREFWTGGTLTRPNILSAGNGEPDVRILSGLFSPQGRGAAILIDGLPSLMHLGVQDQNLAPQLKMALEFIHYESQAVRPGYVAVASQLMELLFIQILRTAIMRSSARIGLLAGLADRNISLALSAVHALDRGILGQGSLLIPDRVRGAVQADSGNHTDAVRQPAANDHCRRSTGAIGSDHRADQNSIGL